MAGSPGAGKTGAGKTKASIALLETLEADGNYILRIDPDNLRSELPSWVNDIARSSIKCRPGWVRPSTLCHARRARQ